MIKIDRNKLEELYINQQLDGREIAKILGVSSWTVWDRLKLFDIPVRRKVPTLKFPFSGDLKEKAYALGFRTGDLYVMKKCNCIRVETSSSQSKFLKVFEKFFSKYGTVKICEKKGNITEKSFHIYCYLDFSFEFLLKKPEEISEWIISNNEYFFSFLAGYSDAEGSWIIANHTTKKGKSKDSIFNLGSCDKKILQQIHQKLQEIGFNPHLYLDREKGTSTQIGKYHSDFYRIRIYGKNVAKLAEIILPFSHYENKQNRMKEIIEFEKMKINSLGTVEIPCIHCNHKKVHKCGSFSYKNKKHKRYRCPICKKVFSEIKLRKITNTNNYFNQNLEWFKVNNNA